MQDRREAVLQLLGGKATVDQLARRFGVLPETVEGWREEALAAMDEALRRGTGRSPRELELEQQVDTLRQAVTQQAIQVALLQREMGIIPRPTRPARSRR